MADVFVSYARADKERVAPLVSALEAHGLSVWWDPAIEAGQQFDDLIEAEMNAARSVLAIWTPASVTSRWVRGEAREAADRGILVPVRFDAARLPMDVRALHTIDLDNWANDPASPAFQDLLRALRSVVARHGGSATELPSVDSAFQYAQIYAQWNRPNDAIKWLEKAAEVHDPGLVAIKVDPFLDPIRKMPRFEDVVAVLNFPT